MFWKPWMSYCDILLDVVCEWRALEHPVIAGLASGCLFGDSVTNYPQALSIFDQHDFANSALNSEVECTFAFHWQSEVGSLVAARVSNAVLPRFCRRKCSRHPSISRYLPTSDMQNIIYAVSHQKDSLSASKPLD